MATPEQPQAQSQDELFQELEDYKWSDDSEFQAGLRAILGPQPEQLGPGQREDLALRARCFYYSRKRARAVDFASYKLWRQQTGRGPAASVPDAHVSHEALPGEPPLSLTFAEVMELVREGKPVPGIKDVPDTVLEGQSTQSTKSERQKPWERAPTEGAAAQPSLFGSGTAHQTT